MILREDYTYILPEISFQTPRYWEHSVMFPTTKSPSVILYGYPLPPIALPGFGIARRNLQTQYFFQRGFSLSCAQCNAYPLYCAPQCNAYPLYCARNKKPSARLGRSTYMFEAIVSQAQFAICGIDQCSSSAALGRATYWNVCRSRDCV